MIDKCRNTAKEEKSCISLKLTKIWFLWEYILTNDPIYLVCFLAYLVILDIPKQDLDTKKNWDNLLSSEKSWNLRWRRVFYTLTDSLCTSFELKFAFSPQINKTVCRVCQYKVAPVHTLLSHPSIRVSLRLYRSVLCSYYSSVQFSRSVLSDSSWPHESQHARPPCPSQLLEFIQTHVHRVYVAIQPSHPLSSPSLPAPNPSQHQGLFQWVNSSHEVAKVLEFQLQHLSFQWTPRTDLL